MSNNQVVVYNGNEGGWIYPTFDVINHPIILKAAGIDACLSVYMAVGNPDFCKHENYVWDELTQCGKPTQLCPDNNTLLITIPGKYTFGTPGNLAILPNLPEDSMITYTVVTDDDMAVAGANCAIVSSLEQIEADTSALVNTTNQIEADTSALVVTTNEIEADTSALVVTTSEIEQDTSAIVLSNDQIVTNTSDIVSSVDSLSSVVQGLGDGLTSVAAYHLDGNGDIYKVEIIRTSDLGEPIVVYAGTNDIVPNVTHDSIMFEPHNPIINNDSSGLYTTPTTPLVVQLNIHDKLFAQNLTGKLVKYRVGSSTPTAITYELADKGTLNLEFTGDVYFVIDGSYTPSVDNPGLVHTKFKIPYGQFTPPI